VGTTTLAAALRSYDRGREVARGVDVLACRATGQSLHQAAGIVAWLVDNGRPRPVLAVTLDQPGQLHNTCKARLRMMDPQLSAVVVLPYVSHWRELSDPLSEAAMLSEQPADELPKPLRPYGRALATLAELVLRSGLLGNPGSTRTAPASAPGTHTGGLPAVSPRGHATQTGQRAVGSHTGGQRAVGSHTGGQRAVGSHTGITAHAGGQRPITCRTASTPAVGNSPATTSGEFLSVPLSRFAAYGGAR